MGPPREHGGMDAAAELEPAKTEASMGPPREHGGMWKACTWPGLATSSFNGAAARTRRNAVEEWQEVIDNWLQWGRRANTAEWLHHAVQPGHGLYASMGPPREHGGMEDWIV